MKRIALTLALLWPLGAQAADAIIHLDTPGQTLYARVMTSSTASVAVALTEGTSNAVGRYVITEASLVSGGLSTAGNYPFKVFSGTPSTSANDTMLGQGVLYWSGSTVLAAPADITFVLGEAVDADPATLNVNVTTIEGVDATDTLGTAQTGDSYALLGSPVGASVSADIAAIQAVVDLFTTAHAEPTGVPAANETPLDKLAYVYMMLRNKITVTADTKTYFDDGGAAEFKKGLTDDGTTYTEAEAAAP